MSKSWTPEQIRNASTYGVCHVCGEPRFTDMTRRVEGEGEKKRIIYEHGIVCPNGHVQDADIEHDLQRLEQRG